MKQDKWKRAENELKERLDERERRDERNKEDLDRLFQMFVDMAEPCVREQIDKQLPRLVTAIKNLFSPGYPALAYFGLTPSATAADVKSAYRRIAREEHTDLGGRGNGEAFTELAHMRRAAFSEIERIERLKRGL